MKFITYRVNIMANIQIRVTDELKQEAAMLFEEMGLSLPEAIRLFLKQSVNNSALPFQPSVKRPNKETLEAFEESKDLSKLKSYENFAELRKDLGI